MLRTGLCLLALTLALACGELARQLPGSLWWQALFSPRLDDARQAVIHFSWLPRLVVCLLAGAALGLAGTLMQQVLRNPLASPTTLGVASGAQLALMMVTLFAPSWLLIGREWIAMAGGSLAMGLVFALAWRRQLNPVVIVFAGLVINLYLAAISMGLLAVLPGGAQGPAGVGQWLIGPEQLERCRLPAAAAAAGRGPGRPAGPPPWCAGAGRCQRP